MTAAERAQATLLEHCSERQRGALPGTLSVVVGAQEYTIEPYGSANAIVRNSWYAPTQTIVGTRMARLPAADCMLAAKLLLEADPNAFMCTAAQCGSVWLD